MIIKYPYFNDEQLNERGYNFAFVLYPESESYETDRILKYIKVLADSADEDLERYAYILHDKDGEKNHYHLCIKFRNSKKLSTVLNKFQLWNYNPNNNQVIIKKGNWLNALNYLIHNTKSSKDKYQYPEDEVVSNISEVILNLRNSKDNDDIFLDLFDFIMNTPNITYSKVINYCREKDKDYLKCFLNRTNNFTFSNLIKERNLGI